MKKDTVQCSCCNGSGRIELTGVYADTLKDIRAIDGEIHGAELARKVGCKATAMNNRIAWLADNGFVIVRVYGRKTFVSATPSEKRR